MRLAVVIPCYNEIESLPALVGGFEVLRRVTPLDLILVNDGSRDGTTDFLVRASAGRPWLRVIHHETNQGFAATLKDGLRFALASGYDLIAQSDGDLTHPPPLIATMASRAAEADLVIASRYVPGGGMRDVPRWRVWLSTAANGFFRTLFGSNVRDMTSGFRLARRGVLEAVDLQSDSFQIQLEFTVRAERLGFHIVEVPLVLVNRKAGRSSFRLAYLFRYIPLLISLVRVPRTGGYGGSPTETPWDFPAK